MGSIAFENQSYINIRTAVQLAKEEPKWRALSAVADPRMANTTFVDEPVGILQ